MSPSTEREILEQLRCVAFDAEFESFQIEEISPAVEDVLGYSEEESRRRGFLLDRLVHPDDAEHVGAQLMEVFAGGPLGFDFRGVRSDGSTVELRALVARHQESGDEMPRFRGVFFERHPSARSRSAGDDRLELALDSANMGVWDWNLPTGAIFWSDKVYHLHGTTREEFGDIFENYESLVDRIHPDDLIGLESTVMQALRTGEDYDIEYRFELADGTYRWLYVKGRIYFDESDEPVRIAGTAQDITPRKTAEIAARRELAERRRAEEELRQLNETLEERVKERTSDLERANEQLQKEVAERAHAERELARANRQLKQSNRELQDFAYVASHDLREPLRKITTFADLLRTEHAEILEGEALMFVDRMQESALRMTKLIEDLLQFSRVKTEARPFANIDLNDVVQSVLEDLEVRIKETDATVHVDELPSIDADPTQMRQLLQNLISNALKFRRDDVPPVIEVTATTVESDQFTDDRMCRLIVKDNGIGLDERHAERIFAPFQRLRKEYEGTGMGLAICRRIAERHHGSIAVSSTSGEGSTFIIDLPFQRPERPEEVADVEQEGP